MVEHSIHVSLHHKLNKELYSFLYGMPDFHRFSVRNIKLCLALEEHLTFNLFNGTVTSQAHSVGNHYTFSHVMYVTLN